MKSKLKKAFQSFRISDILLLIFFILLIGQSALNMLIDAAGSQIDVFIRTSSAAIFGYFISSKFINNDDTDSSDISGISQSYIKSSDINTDSPRSQIGFSIQNDNSYENITGEIKTNNTDNTSSKQLMQILIIGLIGLICLIFMLIFRNLELTGYKTIQPSSMLFLSQMRDFFAGSVGFLIAYTKK